MHFTISNFVAFSTPLEGVVPHMYLDRLGLVTCAMGNLIDPYGPTVTALPWRYGSTLVPYANALAVATEWDVTKRSGKAGTGGGNQAAGKNLFLDADGIQQTVSGQLASNEARLSALFPDWDSLHTEAQLACHSMVWAMGAGELAKWARFCSAIRIADYREAANQSRMRPYTGDGSLERRNNANLTLLVDAAYASENSLLSLAYSDDQLARLAAGTLPVISHWRDDGTWL